ncbi:MAG TPA: single-stranded-DNA-specific exonuclease RecJ [Candidatus Micrarchaeaceae archaeon]|nr:single-stranded-DNA-specific exonuclease RecJ [Candidatus Micrarchaeaceae archaeon]
MKRAPRKWSLPEPAGDGSESAFERVNRTRGSTAALARVAAEAPGEEYDPRLLSDMDRAVELVRQALAGDELIAIYGDYDADGVTACALLVRALRAAGHQPVAYIPQRESEGYGVNADALVELRRQGASLVITVDCGTTAVEVVRERPEGLQLIITDHHLPHTDPGTGVVELAPADALVNPQRPDDRYPFKGLAGVGVAYKLVRALEAAQVVPQGTAEAQLPLVALGTVADMMPLQDENRWLVRQGIRAWPEQAPAGLAHLAKIAGVDGAPTSGDLGFGLAPRINAAGRMDDAWVALRCCLANDPEEARASAAKLEALNQSRRSSLAQALAGARAAVDELPDELPVIVLGSTEIGSGVVGLVAGRLAEEYGRPAFVYSQTGDKWRGSARGVPGLNVVEALRQCSGNLLSYGGHLGAGGFSLAPETAGAAEFGLNLARAVREQLGDRHPVRAFRVDAEVGLRECGLGFAEELLLLQPCGTGNPSVLLCARDLTVVRTEPLGKSGDHLKVILSDTTGSAEAISFSRPHLKSHLPVGRQVDALFELEVDSWRGRRKPRLLLRDLRPAQSSTRGALPAAEF